MDKQPQTSGIVRGYHNKIRANVILVASLGLAACTVVSAQESSNESYVDPNQICSSLEASNSNTGEFTKIGDGIFSDIESFDTPTNAVAELSTEWRDENGAWNTLGIAVVSSFLQESKKDTIEETFDRANRIYLAMNNDGTFAQQSCEYVYDKLTSNSVIVEETSGTLVSLHHKNSEAESGITVSATNDITKDNPIKFITIPNSSKNTVTYGIASDGTAVLYFDRASIDDKNTIKPSKKKDDSEKKRNKTKKSSRNEKVSNHERKSTYIRPVDSDYEITCGLNGYQNISGFHTGVDYSTPTGTKVHAPMSGYVIAVNYNSGRAGNYIEIMHDDGRRSIFQHLSSIKASVGNKVEKGDIVALTGSSGTNNPHLHWTVVKKGIDRDVFPSKDTPGVGNILENPQNLY